MFARSALRAPTQAIRTPASSRLFSQTATANRKVAVLGASGGIGRGHLIDLSAESKINTIKTH